MPYFVIQLDYSQTDRDYCIVKANSRDEALTKQKSNARYVRVIAGPIGGIIWEDK